MSPWARTKSGRSASKAASSAVRARAVTSASVCAGPHQAEVEVGDEAEVGQGPVEQLAMLAGRDQADAEPLGLAEPEDDRGHLDGLGPGPDHAGDDPRPPLLGSAVIRPARSGSGQRSRRPPGCFFGFGWCFQRRWSQRYCSGSRRMIASRAEV